MRNYIDEHINIDESSRHKGEKRTIEILKGK